jgi:methionine-S-sulfoxide reductase
MCNWIACLGILTLPAGFADAREGPGPRKLEVATFAGGCFWHVQDAFDKTRGVVETTAGYMGGSTRNPTQEQVAKGETGQVEAVQVKYDPAQVSYEQLLDVSWQKALPQITIKQLEYPTGQYAPIIFSHSAHQYSLACESLMRLKRAAKTRF